MNTAARCMFALLFASAVSAAEPRVDRFGDPLPDGAVMRLGTVGLRVPSIGGVGFRPSGELVALANGFRLYVWPPSGESPPTIIKLTENPEYSMREALSPDARFAARFKATQTSRRIEVWDISGKQPGIFLTYDIRDAYKLCFSADGRWLAVNESSRDASGVVLCDLTAKTWHRLPLENIQYAESMSFTRDGKRLTVLIRQNTFVIDTATKAITYQRKNGINMTFAALSPDGQTLARQPTQFSGRPEPERELIDVATDMPSQMAKPPAGYARWIDFSPDGKRLLMGDRRGIREWDAAKGQFVTEIAGPADESPPVYSRDGKRLAVHSHEAILLWDVEGRRHVRPELVDVGHMQSIYVITVSPDGKLIATSGGDEAPCIWSAADGRLLARIRSDRGRLVFLPDSKSFIAAGSDRFTPVVYEAATGKELRRFTAPAERTKSETISGLRLTDGGRTLVAEMGPTTVPNKSIDTHWDVATGRELARVEAPGDATMRGFFPRVISPDDRWVAENGSVTSVATKESFILVPRAEVPMLGPAAFSPDSRFVAMLRGSLPSVEQRPGSVVVFDLITRARVAEVATGPAYRVAISPDTRLLATTGLNDVGVWDLATGKRVRHFTGLARAMSMAFTPDGRRLITGHDDTAALVWDLNGVRPVVADMTPVELASRWEALTGVDPAKAYAAEMDLSERPTPAVTLLRKHLKPIGAADADAVRELVSSLSSAVFAEREAATKSLRELGDSAIVKLRAALKSEVSAEAKTRLERLLADADAASVPPGERQRQVRAVAILARINNDDARKLLTDLAAGVPEARQTREAAEALKRSAK